MQSKTEDKKISLIVPFILLLVSIIAIIRITIILSVTKIIIIFILMNIPTVITISVIYLNKRK